MVICNIIHGAYHVMFWIQKWSQNRKKINVVPSRKITRWIWRNITVSHMWTLVAAVNQFIIELIFIIPSLLSQGVTMTFVNDVATERWSKWWREELLSVRLICVADRWGIDPRLYPRIYMLAQERMILLSRHCQLLQIVEPHANYDRQMQHEEQQMNEWMKWTMVIIILEYASQ